MTIETYPEMNAKIVDLLRWDKDNSMLLYAAQRIEELEAGVERLQARLKNAIMAWRALSNSAVPQGDEPVFILDPQDLAEFDDAMEKVTHPAPAVLPCGHPRSAMRSDGAAHWCAECEKEAKG